MASDEASSAGHDHSPILQHLHPRLISRQLFLNQSDALYLRNMQNLHTTEVNKQIYVKFQRTHRLPAEGLRYNVSQDLYSHHSKYTPGLTLSMQRDLRIRNRAILILLLPATLFLFAVGWLLQCEGLRTRARPPQEKQAATENNEIQMQIAMTEEPEEYNN